MSSYKQLRDAVCRCFCVKQKTAYELRISDWSSDVCSSDLTTFAGNALNSGHQVVFMDKWDPQEALDKIERYQVTHTHMVPTQLHRMLQLPDDVKSRFDVSSMRWAIHAAAPCPIDVKRKMLDWWGPVIWEYYAATEGGGTTASPEDWLKYPGTVGTAWAISELKIADDDGRPVPTGEPGTIWMK